jgi:uncharacterized membrane protein YbhN (UPF0104 family)
MQQPLSRKDAETVSRFSMVSIKKHLTNPELLRNFLNVLKILAGVTLLILSIQGIHWKNLSTGIKSANLTGLLLVIGLVIIGLFLKVWRWAILVKNYQIQATKTRLFSAFFVGQAVNIVLPLRGGDIVRIGFFADEPKALPGIASTIVLEKYLDLFALTLCSLWISIQISINNILNVGAWLLPLTGFITILLVAVIIFGSAAWEKIRTDRRVPSRFVVWVDRWVQASMWLRNPRQIAPPVLLTIMIWVVMWLTNMMLFRSLGLQLSSAAAGLVLISVYIGLIPALMPGNIGPFYLFARLALLPFGIIQDQAIVYAVMLHAVVTLPALLGGLIGLMMRERRVAA